MRKILWLNLIFMAFAGLIIGCASQKSHYASSVVDYLYPKRSEHIEREGVPAVLSLPMRVGVAFVPENVSRSSSYPQYSYGKTRHEGAITEKEKMALIQEVSAKFKKLPFVKSIEIIPSAYLKPEGSFENLDQLRTMFGIDVIALISYDQVQFTDQNYLSMSYWTIVGAYVVQGEKNDTHTMLDAVIYDIPSRKMLFRAPGISQIKGSATPVNLSEQLRKDGAASFSDASNHLVEALQIQLDLFKEKVKSEPTEYKVVHKQEYTGNIGGGSMDTSMLVICIIMGSCFCLLYWRKKC